MSGAQDPPGWHGKLPSLGDFASRRLPPAFLAPWDDWLATGLQQLRERNPDGWLPDYLAAPSRRFLLMPGVLPGVAGSQAWAGILMPSVDRVGRYFPFTIAQAVQPLPATAGQMQSLWFWLARLDELAADALQDDWSVDRLEAELARMAGAELEALPVAPGVRPQTPGVLANLDLLPRGDIGQLFSLEAQSLWQQQQSGLAFWYASPELQPPHLQVSLGLPACAADLLGATICRGMPPATP